MMIDATAPDAQVVVSNACYTTAQANAKIGIGQAARPPAAR